MIKVFKQYTYRECPIIIRSTDKFTYEYLLVFEGKFYGTFVTNKLKWNQLNRYFWKDPATQKETQGMVHFLQKAAETTCDTLIAKRDNELDNKQKKQYNRSMPKGQFKHKPTQGFQKGHKFYGDLSGSNHFHKGILH